jgi:hypothetical protein
MERDAFASTMPFRVITIKANGSRVLFSRHRTQRAADELVAGLARIGCVAHVEVDARADDRTQPGESVSRAHLAEDAGE